MSEDRTMGIEDGANEVDNWRVKFHKTVDGGRVPISGKHKRIMLALTKPSYVLQLGPRKTRTEHRIRLRRLLAQLVRQHNWSEASGVLSVLLKGTCKDNSPENNRMKYWVTMELLKHIGNDSINSTTIRHIYEVWMRKIGSMKNRPLEDRFLVQFEFIHFCLTQGNLEEAHHNTICLTQERELESYPISNLFVGLTYYQLWYATIPNNMRLRNSDESYTPMQSDMSGTRFDNLVENSEGSNAVDIQEADAPFQYDSDTSVMDDKQISMDTDINPTREVSFEDDVNLQAEKSHESFQPQGFYMNSAESAGHEEPSFLNDYGDNMQHTSIFSAYGDIDSWLLPLQLPHSTENFEDFICLHRKMFNDHYDGALKYLRFALYSNPPVLAALVPLIQLLLLGDRVKEALHELEKFCHNSNTALPFRLRASLLWRFNCNNHVMLSTCFEDILKKDPTCSHTLARLFSMHQTGDYSSESLLEMIALHLDATYAEYNMWRQFALCFLELSQSEEDRMSVCMNGNEDGHKQRYSVRYNRIPKKFTEAKSAKSWSFRCRWWLTRHFSKNTLVSEIAAGNLPLLTYKAACASHMYGVEFEYVVKAYDCLEKEKCSDMFSFLQMHMQNAIGLYLNLGHKTKR
ncbi:hypothetical protein L1049_001371 [Liquidambar formosana]|uniref:Uncharacterized protein n=1 Tax=Liquidambar formosana TaxID=63359 RepID=A0AAP0R5H0_LIQFO